VQHNVQILGVSFDRVETNKAFADQNGFQFPLLCDTEAVLGKAYGAGDAGFASRISYLIDEQGRIEQAFPRVSPGTHAQEVLSGLQ
jgi:peroxiredoxin Q/BCP